MIACPWCNYSHPEHLTSKQCLKCGASFETLYLCPNNSCPMHRQFQAANKECQNCGHRLLGEFSGRDITWGNAVYRVREFIGGGGMGEVYRGIEQDQSGTYSREVAIKFNKNIVDAEIVKRFQREVQVLNMLQSPHNIRVFTYGELYEERPTGIEIRAQFMVMELLEGITLNDLIKKYGPLPSQEALEVMLQVCSALSEAHQKGVIHRDIKPHNIMLQELGGDRYAKVFDFGLSRITHSLDAKISTSGVVMGTFRYMSPEQALGEDVDHRTDIFSLGVVMYEVLSGRHPFPAKNLFDLFNLHQKGPPPLKEVPPELEAIVKKALAYEKSRRYQAVEDLRKDLELWQKTGISKAFEESSPSINFPNKGDISPEGEKVGKKSPGVFIGIAIVLSFLLFLVGYGFFSVFSRENSEIAVKREKKEGGISLKSKDRTVLARGGNLKDKSVVGLRGNKILSSEKSEKSERADKKMEGKEFTLHSKKESESGRKVVKSLSKSEKVYKKIGKSRKNRKVRRRMENQRGIKKVFVKDKRVKSIEKKRGEKRNKTISNSSVVGSIRESKGGSVVVGGGKDETREVRGKFDVVQPVTSEPRPVERVGIPHPRIERRSVPLFPKPSKKPKVVKKQKLPSCPRESSAVTYIQLDRSLGRRLTPRTSRLINRAASSTVYDAGLNLSQSWSRATVLCKKSYLCSKILGLVQFYCRGYRPYRHCSGYRAEKVCRGGKCIFKCIR